MFILKAVSHTAPSTFRLHEAETFEVRQADQGKEVVLRRGTFPIFEDSTLSLYVGPKYPYSVVYAMTEAGKTVEVIS